MRSCKTRIETAVAAAEVLLAASVVVLAAGVAAAVVVLTVIAVVVVVLSNTFQGFGTFPIITDNCCNANFFNAVELDYIESE